MYLDVQECKDVDDLQNLKHMMILYSRGSFGKQSDQWTKCVIKYLYDAYDEGSEMLLAFLIEVCTVSVYKHVNIQDITI